MRNSQDTTAVPSLPLSPPSSPLPAVHAALSRFAWSLSPLATVVFLVLATAEVAVGEITGIWWTDALAALLRWLGGL